MKTIAIILTTAVLAMNLLISSQAKQSRTIKIKSKDTCITTVTLIDSDGDFLYDKAIEKFCDSCTLSIPIKIKTKSHNDPTPVLGDVNVYVEKCNENQTNNCEKLKIAQGLVDKNEIKHRHKLFFILTFFDQGDNVVAVATRTCDSDTLVITGPTCNVKFGEEPED